MTEKDLLTLKEKIEDAKQKISKLEGAKQTFVEQLQDDWNCKTIEQAEKKCNQFKEEIENLSDQIKQGIEEIDKKYIQ